MMSDVTMESAQILMVTGGEKKMELNSVRGRYYKGVSKKKSPEKNIFCLVIARKSDNARIIPHQKDFYTIV